VPTGCEWPPTFVEPRLLFSLCLRRGGLFYPPPSLLAAQERWPPRPRDVDGLCPNVAGLWPAWAQSSPTSGHVTDDVFYSQERPVLLTSQSRSLTHTRLCGGLRRQRMSYEPTMPRAPFQLGPCPVETKII
jgi:hypothetical protein